MTFIKYYMYNMYQYLKMVERDVDCYAWMCKLDWPSDHFGEQVSDTERRPSQYFQQTTQMVMLPTVRLKMLHKTIPYGWISFKMI